MMKSKFMSMAATAACILIWWLAAKSNLAASMFGKRQSLAGILLSVLYIAMWVYYTHRSQHNVRMICFALFPAALSALVSLLGLLSVLTNASMGLFTLAVPLFLSPLYGVVGPVSLLFPVGYRQIVLFVLCCIVTIPWTLWALRLLEHSEN